MSRGVNKWIGVGYAGSDPETRYMDNGTAVTKVSIACSEAWNDKASGERKERTEWVRLAAFGRLAEIVSEYVRKGSRLYVEGSLRTNSYEKDGEKRYFTEVILKEMVMLGDRSAESSGGSGGGASSGGSRLAQAAPEPMGGEIEDEIPFAQFEKRLLA
jgi:single-strand DNA-binding protein